MYKNKKVYIYSIVFISFFILISFTFFFLYHSKDDVKKLGDLDNYAPIALNDELIVYNYFLDNATFAIGKYNINSKKEINIFSEDNFYISYGIPALVSNVAYLPITLYNNEHNLLSIDLTNNNVENIFTDYNSEPLDSVSTMSDNIYILSSNLNEDGIFTSYIRIYNDITKDMDVCILKESINKNNGEIIKSFACNDGKIYAVIEKKEALNNDIYINIYDGEKYNHLNTLYFDDDIKSSILTNNIVQFYSFGDYIYIRNFADYGIIGEIDGNSIKSIIILPQLRIAYNNKNTKDDYYVFFIRESNEVYILDVKKDNILISNLLLSENESIRNAISDGNNLCFSILDESNTFSYSTKDTHIYSYKYILKLSKEYNKN